MVRYCSMNVLFNFIISNVLVGTKEAKKIVVIKVLLSKIFGE